MEKHPLLLKIENYNQKHGLVRDKDLKAYLVNGEFCNLSVTRFTTFNPPSFVPFLDVYGIIGTLYHEVVEMVLKGQEIDFKALENKYKETIDNLDYDKTNMKKWELEVYEELKETYMFKMMKYDAKLFKRFAGKVKRKFKKYTLIGSEIVIFDRWKKVVGIVDLLVEYKGKIFIFDFKTSKDIGLSHLMQINVYKKMLKSNYRIDVDYINVTKIQRETGVMKDTKISDISDTIWNNLPKDCWLPPTDFGNDF